ncbi:MAG: serine/threonine protein kinase [Chromatiales bacterium]|jgi:serine/threonine protein kinase|nr:serine/threonine protein kinase [Chromatiales bacterium]
MATADPHDETVLAGDSEQYIGRYLIEGVLGEGAMGVVYKGFDTSIRRHVAIKTIHGALLLKDDGDDFVERFRREAQAAGRLQHPNVVMVFEFGQHDDTPYLVLEYIPGRELRDIMDEGQVALETTRAIFSQVLQGLSVAHASGIVHRDIKPQNIFVMPNGLTKVGDFGIARIDSTGLTRTGMILGTPSYMSPEQFTGAELDHRSDLYAASALLYEMLTGAKVFTGKTVTEVMYAVLEKEPALANNLVSTVPARIAAVVAKGLAKRPEDRHQSAEEFLAEFEAACVASSIGRPSRPRTRAAFASTEALTRSALRSVHVDLSGHDEALRTLIACRTRESLSSDATELFQDTAFATLSYDELVQLIRGLARESDPRLAALTLAGDLAKRQYEQSEGNRLAKSIRRLAHSAARQVEHKGQS